MSKKKNQKRHSQSSEAAKRRAKEAEIADYKDRERKRMNPIARNLLLIDLVMLAAAQYMYSMHWISDLISSGLTILGVILLLVALYIQFSGGGKHDRHSL